MVNVKNVLIIMQLKMKCHFVQGKNDKRKVSFLKFFLARRKNNQMQQLTRKKEKRRTITKLLKNKKFLGRIIKEKKFFQ